MSARAIGAAAKELLAYAGHAILLPVGAGPEPEVPADGDTRTVLLVHGLMARASVMRPLRYFLERLGHERFAAFAHGGTDVPRIATELNAFVRERVPRGPIDVVAHSLGGLAV